MNPKARETDIVVQNLEKEVLVYNLKTNKAFCLNHAAATVWQKCDGKRTINDITVETRKELGESVSSDFVKLALNQLRKDDLLEETEGFSTSFGAFSRREMMKKTAFASAIALPIVSTLLAPKAANAQSVMCGMAPLADSCPCTSNGSCTSGCCGPVGNGCIPSNSLNVGDACRANCNCPANCCGFGNLCATTFSVLAGGNCRVDCECQSNDCVGGVCVDP